MKSTVITTSVSSGPDLRSRITFLFMLLVLLTTTLRSAPLGVPSNDSLICLEIEGKIVVPEEHLNKDCTIELIDHDGNIDTIELRDNKRKFKLILCRNTSYAIRISKKGYMSKIINVNTAIVSGSDELHRFVFETPLLKEEAMVHLNKDAMEMPIAIIQFDKEKNCFTYDKEYTSMIKKELRKSKSFGNGHISTSSKAYATAYTN